MDDKWRTVRSTPILKDRWIDLRADECVTPGGVTISPWYVLRYPDWVHVVAVTPDGRLVLVRQYRHAAGQTFLELPGGVVDTGEASTEQAARRELAEETGFTARTWRLISSLHPNPSSQTNRVHVYLATDAVRSGDRRLDRGEEGLRTELVPVAEVVAGLDSGLLGQSTQVGAVLLALTAAGRLKLDIQGDVAAVGAGKAG